MIRSSAPTRIDLAGGTLDIWPLYLLFGNPPVINAAIDLYATVELKPRRDKRIVVQSKDLNLEVDFPSVNAIPKRHALELILKTVKFYAPESGLEVTTDCQAPAGSGIGGSSALNIALHGALNTLVGRRYSKSRLIEIAKNIETQVISAPAGWQDYFPALYGGALAVRPGVAGVDFKRIPLSLDEMTRRFVLCYTGRPRRSGINNWEVMKNALDGKKETVGHLKKIGRAALDMEKVLFNDPLERLAPVFAEEWKARKALAPGISSPEMDRLIRSAMRNGALAAKVCGAGGGGCVAFFVNVDRKDQVREALNKLGARTLDFRFVKRGLRVQNE